MKFKALLLSDVSIGYGTPQVSRLANSLAQKLNFSVTVIEPDEPHRPPLLEAERSWPRDVRTIRVTTTEPPHSPIHRMEWNRVAADIADSLRPELVIAFSRTGLPTLALSRHIRRGRSLSVFYGLEFFDGQSQLADDLVRSKCDLAVFPERHRARLMVESLKLQESPLTTLIVLNAANPASPVDPNRRNGRIILTGSIDAIHTYGELLLSGNMRNVPLDVLGHLSGFSSDLASVPAAISANGLRYLGYRPNNREYLNHLRQYAFSLVMWNPIDKGQLYAAPNKFFEAIASGVPPICAPHPQCVELIETYGCGLLMKDWPNRDIGRVLTSALSILGTEYYEHLVENCTHANNSVLNWDFQIAPFLDFIEKRLKPDS